MKAAGKSPGSSRMRNMAREKSTDEAIRYRALFDQSPFGVLVIDTEGNLLDFNEAAHCQLGYSREEFARLRIADLDPVQNPDEIKKSMEDVLGRGKAEFEVKHRAKNGDIRDVHVITQALVLSGQTIFHTIWRDITEQKRTHEAVQHSEEKFHTLFDSASDAIFILDLEGNFIDINKAAYDRLGYAKDEMLSMHVSRVHSPTYSGQIPGRLALLREQGYAVVYSEHVRKDGTIMPVEVNARVIDYEGRKVIFSIIRDITERKLAEQALRTSEERLAKAQKIAHVGNWEKNLVTGHLYWSEEVYRIYGVDSEHFTPTTDAFIKALHPEDLEPFRNALHAAIYERKPLDLDFRLIRPDGTIRTVYTVGEVTYDPEGRPLIHSGTVQDITERKKLEGALRNSKDFIERILNTVDEAFIVIDRNYRILLANYAYAAQAAMPFQDIVGKFCHEISHQSSIPCFESGEECPIRQCFQVGEPSSCVHRHVNMDGSVLYVETKAFPLKDALGNVTSAIEVINNITDKHLLEEQMLRTQKLEAVGLLAGGIAHDFNNLLQGVLGSISMAKTFSDREGKAFTMLESAESALYQATNLTKQLLTFSKGGEPVKKVIALPSLVDNAAKFSLSGSNVNYRTVVENHLWPVEADEGQIYQVIHNIVLNACEAMPDGGTIGIELQNVLLDEKSGLPLKRGKYVRMDIIDPGTGIPDSHLSKIFDPYFTTKKRGSGLGLATSYSIVAKHGGVIIANSNLGIGSTFTIYLPASDQGLVAEEVQTGGILTGKGRILIMDDEEVVRVVAGHMLESLGYEAEFAENGEQAIEKYRTAMKSNKPFHAVILDLTVRGGMGGKEAVGKLAAMDPKVRAIVSSGYSADDILSHYRDHGFQDVLSKPYQIEVLSRVLHGLLDRKILS